MSASIETTSLGCSAACAMAPLCGASGAPLADNVHRVLRKLAQVRLHRHPEGLDGDRLEVGTAVPGQRRGRLGVGDGVQRRIVVSEVESEDGENVSWGRQLP